jgi:methyltransferase (TIGR00027 family)
VLLGAGLDTFVQRRPDLAARLTVFEVDRPGSQAWKRQRLIELDYGVADGLRLVPDDFETDGSWWAKLAAAGFDAARPAVVSSLGVSMYLTRKANQATLRQLAALAPGSTVVMTFQPPLELMDAADRPGRVFSENGARASGTRSSPSSADGATACGPAAARSSSSPRPDGWRARRGGYRPRSRPMISFMISVVPP